MSTGEREPFLARWSRLKRTGEVAPAPTEPGADAPSAEGAPVPAAMPEPGRAAGPRPADLAALPSVDSITAATDIRGFLVPGVPAELARAALRRAWSADPAIRDFIGLSENAHDFNDPASIPGFGPLAPGTDVRRMAEQVLGRWGEPPAERAAKDQQSSGNEDRRADAGGPVDDAPQVSDFSSPQNGTSNVISSMQMTSSDVAVAGPAELFAEQPEEIVAVQKSSSTRPIQPKRTRGGHGGALPE